MRAAATSALVANLVVAACVTDHREEKLDGADR